MSHYPINTQQGLYQAVNYLASGPSGLGQNFEGYSDYNTKYLTGNYRLPFTQSNVAKVYVANIACSSAVQLDDYTFQYNFTTVQSTPPFAQGEPIIGYNFANDYYNGQWSPIGVANCTTSYVVVKGQSAAPGTGNTTTGNIGYTITNSGLVSSTDCNARVTVQGGTDRVFISAQLTDTLSYVGSGNLTYTVQVNRYIGTLNNDPKNPDYLFNFDATISQKVYNFNSLTGPGTLPEVETIFNTVIDTPAPNYYWYILEVEFESTGNLNVSQAALGLRSLSVQVVKQ